MAHHHLDGLTGRPRAVDLRPDRGRRVVELDVGVGVGDRDRQPDGGGDVLADGPDRVVVDRDLRLDLLNALRWSSVPLISTVRLGIGWVSR
jgi:hypothetical protein